MAATASRRLPQHVEHRSHGDQILWTVRYRSRCYIRKPLGVLLRQKVGFYLALEGLNAAIVGKLYREVVLRNECRMNERRIT